MSEWQPISSAPTGPVVKDGNLVYGRWLMLRRGADETVGRWRHEVRQWSDEAQANVTRPPAWYGVNDAPLDFEPDAWAPHSGGMPGH
jgi:hypothetical protein